VSNDNLATVSRWTALAGLFGPGGNSSSTCSFDIEPNGTIHAVIAYRNGVIEGRGTDEVVSAFYLTGQPTTGNWWLSPNSKFYMLGKLQRREQGGASALGQGSVIVDGDKVHLYYGVEDRTGIVGGVGAGNRISNIYETTVFLDDKGLFYNCLTDLADNRAVTSQLRKISGKDAFSIPFGDTNGLNSAIISGRPNFSRSPTTLVVSSATLTLPEGRTNGAFYVRTGGPSAAFVDNISTAGATDGDVIVLRPFTASEDTTYRNDSGGNLKMEANFTMNGTNNVSMWMYWSGSWLLLSKSLNT
jgi:hypothetical protein